MSVQDENRSPVHPMAGITAQRMADLRGPLGWGDSCRLLTVEEAVSILRRFELFAGLSDDELVEVARLCHLCTWSQGSVLFRERESARNFCLLMEGQVALEKEVRLGPHSPPRQATVEFISPGGALAWSSVVPPFLYTKTAVAVTPTVALCMEGQAMRDLMVRQPQVGTVVMSRVAAIIKSRLEHQASMLLYFLSIVSHELRAPLAAVENYLQVMLNGYAGPLTPDQQRMLERSILRLGEMSELISGVLDLARMQPEQIRQSFEPIDLEEIVREAVEDVQLRVKQQGLQLDLEVPQRYPEMVAAHRRLRQVLSNLLSNAVKFSPEGARIGLAIVPEAETLRIEVTDQGSGIPREELDHIFEAFYKVRGTGETAGLGLGLSIVKRIVDAHDGRIWAESPHPPGARGGTKFMVELPLRQPTTS